MVRPKRRLQSAKSFPGPRADNSLAIPAGAPNHPVMPKWLKFLLAVGLLPACLGGAQALWRVLAASGSADTTWVPLLAGAACWAVVFLLLPKPMLVYVFGHELTHALWTWLFGGSVEKLKASAKGGHVIVSKSNFLIALAPYFFPLYALLVVAVFTLGHRLWDWHRYRAGFHLLLGAAYGFHATLTWHILETEQSDVADQGYLFSAVTILLGNLAVLLVGIPLLTDQVGVLAALRWWLADTRGVFLWLGRLV